MPELHWKKSTYSPDASNCVEIATTPTTVHIRDSKTPTARHLTLAPSTWADFLPHLRAGQGSGTAQVV
ncbi:DUF397 domain-containing protein [Streptomyces sp. NPDC046870]|uniref:DUF397 domain-containing protein n=1 Tax=Streptomyces sp. NPDC046870 TaxID=3155135 RepID=UPI00345626E3